MSSKVFILILSLVLIELSFYCSGQQDQADDNIENDDVNHVQSYHLVSFNTIYDK